MTTLNPIPFESAANFCMAAFSFLPPLNPEAAAARPAGVSEHALSAFQVLLKPREILEYPQFAGSPDRLSIFAKQFAAVLPEEEREIQTKIYERNFKPGVGISVEYQASRYFPALIAQMLQGLQVCSPKSWEDFLETMPLKNGKYLANVLEMYNDYESAKNVHERYWTRMATLFWGLFSETIG